MTASPDLNDGTSGLNRDPSENNLEEQAEYEKWARGRERSPFREMIASGKAREVRHAVRMICSGIEKDVLFDGEQPNSYVMRQYFQELRERDLALSYTFPLGMAEWPRSLNEGGYDRDPQKRRELIRVLRESQDEILARTNLAEKFLEQMTFSSDVGIYLKDYFQRLGKKLTPCHAYGVILRSKETHENFIPLGEKVETAFNCFNMIGEGQALLANGKKLPNIFGLPPHRGLWEYAFTNYVLPELRKKRERRSVRSNPEAAELEDFDDRCAAILGLQLFRHFDYDVYYCFGMKGTGETFANRFQLSDREIRDLNLEMGLGTGDSGKAMYIEARRWAEWGRGEKTKHREFPRQAGNPMSFGCYPMLTLPMLELVTTEMVVDRSIENQIAELVSREGIRDYDMPQVIPIPIHTYCFGNPNPRFFSEEDPNAKYSWEIDVKTYPGGRKKDQPAEKCRVRVRFTPTTLANIPWDEAREIKGTDPQWQAFALGPQTDSFEVPYKLQGYYAFVSMYYEFMRTDYWKQYEEIVGGDTLLKMNKGIEVALGMMAGAFNIRSSTMEKLSIYIRCVFLGTLGAAVEQNKTHDLERTARINEYFGKSALGGDVDSAIREAVRISSFLPLSEGFVKGEYEGVMTEIRKARRAPTPRHFQINGRPFFSEYDIEELKVLYPLGVD